LKLFIALSIAALLVAIAFGWLFTAAYYNSSSFGGVGLRMFLHAQLGAPSVRNVVTAFLVTYVACAGCLVLVSRRMVLSGSTANRSLLSAAALAGPIVFVLSALAFREMMEAGLIFDSSELLDSPLEVGSSMWLGGLEFKQTAHGLGVSNLGDSGTVFDLLTRSNQRLPTTLVAIAWCATALGLLAVGTRPRARSTD
jgi:hypothetical protein